MADAGGAGGAMEAEIGGMRGEDPALDVGQRVEIKSKALGRFKQVRDILMGEHRSSWNRVVVEGVVMAKIKNNKYMVDWNISGERLRLCVRGDILTRHQEGKITSESLNKVRGQTGQGTTDETVICSMEVDPEDDISYENEALPADSLSAPPCNLADDALDWNVCEGGIRSDQRKKLGFEFAKTTINWPEPMQSADRKSELDCWRLVFPWQYFFGKNRKSGTCLHWTNESLPANVVPFTENEFLQCIGVLYAKAVFPKGNLRGLWGCGGGELVRSPDLGTRYQVSWERFDMWLNHVKICSPEFENSHNKTEHNRPLIDALIHNRLQSIHAGSELILYEDSGRSSMSEEFTCGIRLDWNQTTSIPNRTGTEYTKLAECTYGISLAVEPRQYQECSRKSGSGEVSNCTAMLFSFAKNYLDKGHVIYGSSGFSSVGTAKALLLRKTFFTGFLRKSPSGFPKHSLKVEANPSHGKHKAKETAVARVESQGDMLHMYCQGWTEHSQFGEQKRFLLSTWNTTEQATDQSDDLSRGHVDRRKQGEDFSEVPISKVVMSYLTAATTIHAQDQCNLIDMLQEYSEENCNGHLEILCDILRLIEADAFKVFCACNTLKGPVRHVVFTEVLATKLLTTGADVGRAHSDASVQQYADSDLKDGSSTETGHTLGMVDEHVMKWNLNFPRSRSDRRASRVRCRICKGNAGQGCLTTVCCLFCSEKDSKKRPYGICAPGTRRKCFSEHLKQFQKKIS
eukprot:243313-Hanusia_phi.AAC.2